MGLTWYQVLTMFSMIIGILTTILSGNIILGAVTGIGSIFVIFLLVLIYLVKFKFNVKW